MNCPSRWSERNVPDLFLVKDFTLRNELQHGIHDPAICHRLGSKHAGFEGMRISLGLSVDEKHPHRTSGSEQSNVGDISTRARRVSRKRARSMLVNRDQACRDNGESDHPLHFRTMERSCINIGLITKPTFDPSREKFAATRIRRRRDRRLLRIGGSSRVSSRVRARTHDR